MRRKKVLLVGPPFCGHLHPLLGVACRLQAVAEVKVLSTPGGVAAARKAGLPGREIMAAHEQTVWEIAEPGSDVKNNPLLLYRQLKGNVGLMVRMKQELDAVFAEEKPDLVIADFTVPVAGLSAMQQGIGWWTTLPSPCVFETVDGPPAYFGGQRPATTAFQEVKQAGMRQATRVFKRLMWRLFRREFRGIGFDHVYCPDGSEAVYSPQRILALGVKAIEFPRSYPASFHFTGPVLYTPPFEGTEPAFASDDRPHVLVSLGTHLPQAKAALAAQVREMAQRHPGLVFHFTYGKEAHGNVSSQGNYHEYPYISYQEHLPRYRLVVHHAGAGVMNHCLRHGVPAVVHPVDFDQFDNAARLVAAGVALRVQAGSGDLETVILQALQSQALKERCAEMKAIVSRYDAPGLIAQWVTDLR